MVIGEAVLNLTEFISILPPQIMERMDGLIIILKAVGIAAIVYVIYVVTMGFVNFRRAKRIKYIEQKVNSIDKKLDTLIRVKKKKRS